MPDITLSEFPLNWQEYTGNPVISPSFPAHIIADPTFLLPTETPDGLWHLFAHSLFLGWNKYGVLHFTSNNGINWERHPGIVIEKAIRPFLYIENNTYFMLYEKIGNAIPYDNSSIEIIESQDLTNWGNKKTLLNPSLNWHKDGSKKGVVSNPCLIKIGNNYRLYYSAGLSYLKDCGFSEPKYIGYAESNNLHGKFETYINPIIEPTPDDKYLNLAAGSIKVIIHNGYFLGVQNGLYWNNQTRHSGSAIRLWKSDDGRIWKLVRTEPIIRPDKGWKKRFVYANDIRVSNNVFIMYFNSRDNWFWGREKIGFATATIK